MTHTKIYIVEVGAAQIGPSFDNWDAAQAHAAELAEQGVSGHSVVAYDAPASEAADCTNPEPQEITMDWVRGMDGAA